MLWRRKGVNLHTLLHGAIRSSEMGGEVTWSRDSDKPHQWRIRWRLQSNFPYSVKSGDTRTGNPPLHLPRQETTSYRTGSPGTSEDDKAIPTSRSDAFRTWWLENRDLSSPFDHGHPFDSSNQGVLLSHAGQSIVDISNGRKEYSGPLFSDFRFHAHGTFVPVVMPDLTWYGTNAINKTSPTNPAVELTRGLAELIREGFPTLPNVGNGHFDGVVDFFQRLGKEYIRQEFGWKPFLSEIEDLLRLVKKADAILKQYIARDGKVNRRRLSFPVEYGPSYSAEGTGAIANSPNNPEFSYLFQSLSGQRKEVVTQQTNIWFVGAFTYYIDRGTDILSKMKSVEQKINYLLGVRITPAILWELAPYSWLSDWLWNLGDVLSNVSKFQEDSLVLRYGYTMATARTDHTVSIRGIKLRSGYAYGPIDTIYTNIVKKRIKASPYGFSLSPDGLSDRQKAILAALLASKSSG